MKNKKAIFIFILILISTNLFCFTLIRADVEGWGSVKILIHSETNGPFTIQRKTINGEYRNLVTTTKKTYTDTTTKMNTRYIYRIKTRKALSNNSPASTNVRRIIMVNRKKPAWIYKNEFSTKNYYFKVMKFENGYDGLPGLKKKFLLSLIIRNIKPVYSPENKKLFNFFINSITGHSLRRAKPYMEKIRVLSKSKYKDFTVAYLLYGIKKAALKKIIKTGKAIISGNAYKTNISETDIHEPVVKMQITLYKERKNIKNALLNKINEFRKSYGLKFLSLFGSPNRVKYMFSPKSKEKYLTFIWGGNLLSCAKLINDRKFLARTAISQITKTHKKFLLSANRVIKIIPKLNIAGKHAKIRIKLIVN